MLIILHIRFNSGNYSNHGPNANEVLSDIMSKGHVMHIRFELDHLKASPQIEEQYVTEVLSGRLRLFQKELIAPEVVPTSQTVVIHSSYNHTIKLTLYFYPG